MQLTFEKIKRKSHKNEFEWVEYLYENKLFICNNNDEELLLECMLITSFFAESCDEFISFICLYKIQRILVSWCIFWRHSYHFEWHSTLRDEIDDKKKHQTNLIKSIISFIFEDYSHSSIILVTLLRFFFFLFIFYACMHARVDNILFHSCLFELFFFPHI